MPSSSSSEDERVTSKRAPPTSHQVHVIRSTKQEKKIRCSRLIRNKWFIIGVGALVLLIILAIVLGVTLGSKSSSYEPVPVVPLHWWQNATFYRAYVTSFLDSNGDGRGDLRGLQDRLSYLVELGVDVLWLSPIQATSSISAQDVENFEKLKEIYGMRQDLADLISTAKALGLRVIMDIIMNHSGSGHQWFRQSLTNTGPFRDYYVWNGGRPAGGSGVRPAPPNNWVSIYGGSAWEWSPSRQEYYLHQFSRTEPDLNYRNPQIVSEMSKIVRYWDSEGVDGFFIRDVPWWYEDAQLRDEVQLTSTDEYASLSHNNTRDLAESYEAVNNIFISSIGPKLGLDKILLAKSSDRILSDDRAGMTYQLVTTKALYDLKSMFNGFDVKNAVQQTIDSFNKSGLWPLWALGDEDHTRIMNKFDQLSVGLQMIQLLLPGSYSIYYGEEIQMKDHPSISYDDTVDRVALDSGPQNYTKLSRDPYHTPMLWNSSRHYGFTSAQVPWLPIYNSGQTVESMKARTNSLWNTIKLLTRAKKASVALANGTIDYPLVDNEVFSFTRIHPHDRTGYLIVWNIGNQRKTLTFDNATYIPYEINVVCKVKFDGSRNETTVIRKNDVSVDPKELILFSFWK